MHYIVYILRKPTYDAQFLTAISLVNGEPR
jgi:hypothetical protein